MRVCKYDTSIHQSIFNIDNTANFSSANLYSYFFHPLDFAFNNIRSSNSLQSLATYNLSSTIDHYSIIQDAFDEWTT